MMAVFCESGRQPSRSEAFTIAVTYVRSTSSESFKRKVGMGSCVHDLVGDDMIARRTSSSEQTRSSVSVELTACDGSDGGGQLAVLALTDSTFFSKNWIKSSAVCFDVPVTLCHHDAESWSESCLFTCKN